MARQSDTRTCSDCARFTDDPVAIEALFVGMTVLSSAYGSTRGDAGVCAVEGVFQNPVQACGEFLPRIDTEAR